MLKKKFSTKKCFFFKFLFTFLEKTVLDRILTRFLALKKPRYIEYRGMGEPRYIGGVPVVGHEVQAAQGAGDVSGSSRNSNSGGQARSSHRAMSQVYLQEDRLAFFSIWA